MHIALVYPATEFDNVYHKFALPYGLLSLAAVVEGSGIGSVDVFDSRHMAVIPATEDLNNYDVIGFTAMSMQVSHALDLAKEIRRNGYIGHIVFGGPHASVAPDHLKGEEVVDGIFIGEAEETFVQYLNRLSGKTHVLQRVWLRDESRKWIYFDGYDFINDLDSLPFPAREKYEAVMRETLFINITTTRGCPYQCNYCQPSKQILFGKKIRRRSVDNIIKEIREYMDAYAITSFSIDDDTFTFNESVVVEFCEKVKPLKLSWTCQTRTDIKTSTLSIMKESGCSSLFVGVESGSQRMLNLMDKNNTVKNNERFLNACKEVGISTWCNMMAGYPGETIEEMSESLRFLKRTLPERVSVSQVTPFPGTKVWSDNIDDLIQLDWDDVARHVRKPKFRSMASLQAPIDLYIILMAKEFDGIMLGRYIPCDRILAKTVMMFPGFFHFVFETAWRFYRVILRPLLKL